MIYFVRAGQNGPVKIGTAQDTRARMADLQIGNHELLSLLREIDGGEREERWLHDHYASRRIRGEWFRFCPTMLSVTPPNEAGNDRAATFAGVISLWQPIADLARDIGRDPGTVRQWRNRNSIPVDDWDSIIIAAQRRRFDQVTLSLLMRLRGKKKATAA